MCVRVGWGWDGGHSQQGWMVALAVPALVGRAQAAAHAAGHPCPPAPPASACAPPHPSPPLPLTLPPHPPRTLWLRASTLMWRGLCPRCRSTSRCQTPSSASSCWAGWGEAPRWASRGAGPRTGPVRALYRLAHGAWLACRAAPASCAVLCCAVLCCAVLCGAQPQPPAPSPSPPPIAAACWTACPMWTLRRTYPRCCPACWACCAMTRQRFAPPAPSCCRHVPHGCAGWDAAAAGGRAAAGVH